MVSIPGPCLVLKVDVMFVFKVAFRTAREMGHFRVALNLIMKARLRAKFFFFLISFHSYTN